MLTLRHGLTVGPSAPIRVNCNIGCNSENEYATELQKIYSIRDSGVLPDTLMDLSLVRVSKPLYSVAREQLRVETGTVLSYIPFKIGNVLDWNECRQYLIELCEGGISFVTIHFTANSELYDLAKGTRKVPVTSRGGGICLYDILKKHRKQNLFLQHIDEIAEIVKRYGVAISLGATFRPSNIFDACDEVHIKETQAQLEICRYLQSRDVKVLVENIGHIGLDKLEQHSALLRKFQAPIMPLGPLPTDAAIGIDQVNNAIGASFAAYWGCAHIINCITKNEHFKDSFTSEDIIEGIRTAKLAAHIVNLSNGSGMDCDRNIDFERANDKSCVIGNGQCSRCGSVCPLKLI